MSGVFFGVSDGGFDFSFSIWIFDPARQGDHAVVGEDVAIEWIQSGVVDVGDEHAFAQVIEHDDTGTTTQSAKRFLVQLGPDARAGAESQQAYCLTAIAEGQHEQSCASIFAGLRIADHRAGAVIDLGLFSWRGKDYRTRLQGRVSAKLANETFDRLIATAKPTLGHQILPDRHGIAIAAQTQFDRIPERFAETGGQSTLRLFRSRVAQLHAKPGGHLILIGRFCGFCFCFSLRRKVFGVGVGVGVGVDVGRFCRVRPGGHLVGRFCRRSPSPHPRRTHSDPGRFQVGTGGLPTHPGLLLDAPQGPSESSQGYNLLFFRFAQDVAHTDEG